MINAKMFADNKNSNFYFFLIPHYGRFEADRKQLDKLDYNKKKIINFLKNNEILYFDIYSKIIIEKTYIHQHHIITLIKKVIIY